MSKGSLLRTRGAQTRRKVRDACRVSPPCSKNASVRTDAHARHASGRKSHPNYGYRTDNKKPPVTYRFLNLSVILDLSPGVFI